MTCDLWLGSIWTLVFTTLCDLWPVTRIQLHISFMSNCILKYKIVNSLPYVTCNLWLGSNCTLVSWPIGYWNLNNNSTALCDLWPVTSDWDPIRHYFKVQLDVEIKITNSLPSVTCDLRMRSNWTLVSWPIRSWNQNYKFNKLCDLWHVTGIQLDVRFLSIYESMQLKKYIHFEIKLNLTLTLTLILNLTHLT